MQTASVPSLFKELYPTSCAEGSTVINRERKFENLHRLIERFLASVKDLRKTDITRKQNRMTTWKSWTYRSPIVKLLQCTLSSTGTTTTHKAPYTGTKASLSTWLAACLIGIATGTDKFNPYAASVLRKLGTALECLSGGTLRSICPLRRL